VGSRPVKRAERRAPVLEIEIPGDLDAHAVEALRLELRRLAERYGAEIEEFQVPEVADNPPE